MRVAALSGTGFSTCLTTMIAILLTAKFSAKRYVRLPRILMAGAAAFLQPFDHGVRDNGPDMPHRVHAIAGAFCRLGLARARSGSE
jgi:hypothetical protein